MNSLTTTEVRTGPSNSLRLPDLYAQSGTRPPTYNYVNFQQDWDAYKTAILAANPSAKLTGLDDCCNDTWLQSLAGAEASSITELTKHFYPTSATSMNPPTEPTIANLLSPALMQTTATNLDTWVADAAANHLPLAITETNSASGGGVSGVSNTLGAALWGTDYLFTALEHKVSNVDFHTGTSPSIYSPIDTHGNAAPLYYALLLFHYAAANGNAVETSVQSSNNVTAHAVVGNDGKLRVVLINKDQTNPVTVQLNTTQAYSQASAITLTAPTAASTNNLTFGGSSVASNGTWTPQATINVPVSGAMATITLIPASATVVTFQ